MTQGKMMQCGHCGYIHSNPCPRIKTIEYHSDGTVKRIEYHERYFSNYPAMPPVLVNGEQKR